MWVLIVLQLMAGSGTAKNSLPITYTGVVTQEFSSKESCEAGAKAIKELSASHGSAMSGTVRNGVLETKCIQK